MVEGVSLYVLHHKQIEDLKVEAGEEERLPDLLVVELLSGSQLLQVVVVSEQTSNRCAVPSSQFLKGQLDDQQFPITNVINSFSRSQLSRKDSTQVTPHLA